MINNTGHITKVRHSKALLCRLLFGLCATAVFPQTVQKIDSSVKKDSSKTHVKQIRFNGKDGPYIVDDTLYRVTAKNKLIVKSSFVKDSIVVRADNINEDEFYLSLRSKYSIPKSNYKATSKMIVISDIEGKYNAFASFLLSNKVIDEQHNWIYGKGKLVLVGDFVDRGKNVTQVLWLIYKLEQQAAKQGGKVHFILGNHEVLNFQGNHTYNRGKYIKVAQEITGQRNKTKAVKYLYSKNSELGRWLSTKNVVEKIGDYLFVHAGLSPEILEYNLTLDAINDKVRSRYSGFNIKENDTLTFLYGSKGPFWYRGLVIPRQKYAKIKSYELDRLLTYYEVNKIVVGHTVVNTVSSDFEGKVIRLDVSHGNKKFSGNTKGLLVENGEEFVINDKGEKRPLSAL